MSSASNVDLDRDKLVEALRRHRDELQRLGVTSLSIFGSRSLPRNRGKPSAYLWSFSNHYEKGKYVRDRVWDPNYVSKQCAPRSS